MKLVIEDEAGTRSIVPFATDTIVVGRGTEDVTFRLNERNVSRRHARFSRLSGAVFVEDLGSLTGTRVNGEKITGRRKLRDGDLVQIGDYDLALLAEDATLEPRAPPPLPPGPRADDGATTARALAAVEPTAAASAEARSPAAPAAPPRRILQVAIAFGVVALAVGVAAGWAVGALTGPVTPP